MSLEWKPPVSDGGSPVTNYIIEYRVEGGFKWLKANEYTVNETNYTIKALKNDETYEFRIAAENRAGVGPASDPTKPIKVKEPIGKLIFTNFHTAQLLNLQIVLLLNVTNCIKFNIPQNNVAYFYLQTFRKIKEAILFI